MLTKSAKLFLISLPFICSALLFDAPLIAAASHLTTAAPMAFSDAAQTRTGKKRRPRPRRRSRPRTPPSNTNTATEAAKPAATSQPVIRVYNPAEDAPPPVRPTPTPGMRNP